jgi:hypothetical protein
MTAGWGQPARGPAGAEDRFYFKLAMAIAVTVIAGFGFQFAMGRSSFSAPLLTHVHAIVFMAWVGLFVVQSWAVAYGRRHWHRRLGWIAMIHVPLMIALGLAVTVAIVRRGTAPFFFMPQHFLIADPATVLCFAGLTFAAIRLRRSTDWHKRLHLCAMAALMGPAVGRLLPMPLMTPIGFELAALPGLLFPLAALARDWRHRSIHPAWRWGLPALPLALGLTALIAYSPAGGAIYQWVTAGSPGALVAPLAFPSPP